MAAVLLGASCCISLRAVNTIIHNATYDFSNLTIGSDTLGGVTYATISYGDLFNGGASGTPSLPIDYIRFSVPWNATNFTVSASLHNSNTDNINRLVYPCQTPRMMNDTTPVTITLPDSAVYYSNSYYPTQCAWVVDEGFLAGENHIVTVAVMPISFKHSGTGALAHNMLRKSQTVRLTLNYQLSDSLPMYPIVRQDSALRQEGYALTRSMVVNPTSVDTYAPVEIKLDSIEFIIPNSGDGLNGDPNPHINPDDPPIYNDSIYHDMGGELHIDSYQYLIVTTDEFAHSVRRIAALKRQKGYGVKVVTMDEVLSSPYNMGGDLIQQNDSTKLVDSTDAGKLRQFLKYYYSAYGTEYVLLVGNGVPYQRIRIRTLSDETDSVSTPSDLYYSDINGDWSRYSIDYQPELFIGRVLAKDNEQIANYTDKLLRYELNPGNGNFCYLKRIIYSEGYDLVNSGEVYEVRKYMDSVFPQNCILSESRNINDQSKFPSGDNIIDSINTYQFGFISLHHHGFPAGLLTYGYRKGMKKDSFRFLWAIDSIHVTKSSVNDDPSTTNGLNKISNKKFPSICYSTGCTTIPYDTIPGYESIPMNFGESFTTGKDYGGPAYLGHTRDAWSPCTGLLEKLFAKSLSFGHFHIGIANGVAKSEAPYALYSADSVSAKHVPVTQNLLGDPEFEIWTDEPMLFTNIEVTRTDNSISISGIDANSTIISFYGNQYETQGIKRIVNSFPQTFDISPNSSIMLYKHNLIPYIPPLVLQNTRLSNDQYVLATDVTAGNSVDSNRTPGNVTIKNGVEYEIEASGTVTLQDGFSVEKGATFAVYPSSF